MSEFPEMQGPVCPLPLSHHEKIMLGHGSGGKLMHDLIEKVFFPPLDNPTLRIADDAGVVAIVDKVKNEPTRIAISTDSHVVWPLFFPGGDIGRLAVCGTVNDIAMMGATPRYLTAGFILEEGLEVSLLEKILYSMQDAAAEAEIEIIAGDTKVVQHGKADKIYINTSGIGAINHSLNISGTNAQVGDSVIVSGTIGDHGIAVLEARNELGFESGIRSDVAPLNHLVSAVLNTGADVHVMRDPTRGGLATTLNEIAKQSNIGIRIFEDKIPVNPAVESACEILGFDPIHIANEGKMVVFVPDEDADKVLMAMRNMRYGENATLIGEVIAAPKGKVLMQTQIGSQRVVDIPSGEILPRIC